MRLCGCVEASVGHGELSRTWAALIRQMAASIKNHDGGATRIVSFD